ncbi:hypothetical protein NL676_009340 [Syzygium grande]|nr:hypothetical protein NL676_009340 [Syzygium grande]
MEISTRPAHPGVSLNSRLLRFCSSTEQLTPGPTIHLRRTLPRAHSLNPEPNPTPPTLQELGKGRGRGPRESLDGPPPELDPGSGPRVRPLACLQCLARGTQLRARAPVLPVGRAAGLFRHDRETHLKKIEILGRASKLNHARCILLDMPKKGVEWDEDLFVVMIESYGKAGIVQEAVKMFMKMKELGDSRSVDSCDAVFKVILRRGRYMMAKPLFNAMLNEGIEPTRHTYNIMIWGFFLSMRLPTALRFFEDMKSRGISPDAVTYNIQ